MRPASFYYLAQAWPSRQRAAAPSARSRAKGRGRHAQASRRYHPGRELPALGRRILAALSGSSQPA